MIKDKKQLSAIVLSLMLPMAVNAEVLVVDGNEALAMVEEQQPVMDGPIAKAQLDQSQTEQAQIEQTDAETANNDTPSSEVPFAVDNEQQDKALNSANNDASLLEKIQGLQQTIQELRGQLEVQSHDLNLLKEQQLAFYKDVDLRLNQNRLHGPRAQPTEIEAATVGAAAAVKQEVNEPHVEAITHPENKIPALNKASRVNPADEQISYLAAYDLVKSKRYDDAIKAMQGFVIQYPQGGYTANAHYWLGELYLAKNQYPQAIEHFEIVTEKFPSSSKAGDSLLKVGYALGASGKTDEARLKLQQVIKNYPDTQTATLAKSKLETLNRL